MVRRSTLVLGIGALAALGACSPDQSVPTAPVLRANVSAGQGTEGRYLVVFTKQSGEPADIDSRVERLGGRVDRKLGQIGVAVVTGLTSTAATQLAASSDVSQVAPDPTITLDDAFGDPEAAGNSGTVTPASQGAPSTAYFFPRQWNMRAIGADTGWAAGKLGSSDVKVFILDTGIGYTHPDLAGRVDLALSRSFVPSDDSLVATYFPGANPIADLFFHGTHVAATVSSNALAAAGVTSKVTLVGVKVLGATGTGSSSGVLQGIIYAADNGADVINLSLGSAFSRAGGNGAFIAAINRVTDYAYRHGSLVVVAAGNSALDMDSNPTTFVAYCEASNVVCVSATGPTAAGGVNGPFVNVDAFAPYSNFGRRGIDVAAPGGSYSYVYAACSPFTLVPVLAPCQRGVYVIGATGTSMATPHVSGLAALLVQRFGHDHPGLIRAVLEKSAVDLGPRGRDAYYGYGRIDVPQALGVGGQQGQQESAVGRS